MTITRLDREERDDRRQLINSGGIREPATGLRSKLVERAKIYVFRTMWLRSDSVQNYVSLLM